MFRHIEWWYWKRGPWASRRIFSCKPLKLVTFFTFFSPCDHDMLVHPSHGTIIVGILTTELFQAIGYTTEVGVFRCFKRSFRKNWSKHSDIFRNFPVQYGVFISKYLDVDIKLRTKNFTFILLKARFLKASHGISTMMYSFSRLVFQVHQPFGVTSYLLAAVACPCDFLVGLRGQILRGGLESKEQSSWDHENGDNQRTKLSGCNSYDVSCFFKSFEVRNLGKHNRMNQQVKASRIRSSLTCSAWIWLKMTINVILNHM